jgi:lysophospholipase L1-like esterase
MRPPPGQRLLRAMGLLLLAGLLGWGLLQVLGFLLVHEAAIRHARALLETGSQDRDRPASLPFQRQSDELLWENVPGYVLPGSDPPRLFTNSLGCQGPEPSELAPETPRILCQGDSCTFGLGVGQDETYASQLAALLPRLGSRPAGVVNCGVVGYTVLQGLLQLRQLGPQVRPDVVVSGFGYNERWRHRTGDAAALAARRSRARLRLLERSDTFLLMRHLLLGLLPPPDPQSRRRARVLPEEFEAGLRALVRTAEAMGARPVILTIAEHPSLVPPIQRARDLVEAGDFAGAVPVLAKVVQSRWHRYPLADELCARVVEALGEDGVPDVVARRAKLAGRDDWGREFSEDRYLAIAGRVAEESGALLVRFPPRPDPDLYADDIHPSAEGHRWIAETIAAELLRRGWLGP